MRKFEYAGRFDNSQLPARWINRKCPILDNSQFRVAFGTDWISDDCYGYSGGFKVWLYIFNAFCPAVLIIYISVTIGYTLHPGKWLVKFKIIIKNTS